MKPGERAHARWVGDSPPMASFPARAWRALDPAWRFGIVSYLLARGGLLVWSLVVLALFPAVVQNLDLFGAPTLAYFDLTTSERLAFSREVGGRELSFQRAGPGQVMDLQTGTTWSLPSGRALAGPLAAAALSAATYSAEEIFPYRGVEPDRLTWLALWQRFDTNWYLALAAHGYASDGSTVYLPLYPFLIALVQVLTRSGPLAALLISNAALVGALAFLFRITTHLEGPASASRAAAFLLLFPTAFFLMAGYTESLFLLCALASLYFAERNRWSLSAFSGTLAALTRLQGVALLLPLVYLWWKGKRSVQEGLRLFALPAASLIFIAFTRLSLFDAYAGQLHALFVWPWDNIAAAVRLIAQGDASFVDAFNLAVTLGLILAIVPMWRRLPREYALFAVTMVLAPLFRMTTTQPLVSMGRYALAAVPLFMLFGVWGRNPWVTRAIVYLGFPLQLYFSAQFFLWGWVG